MLMDVYVPEIVNELKEFYEDRLVDLKSYDTIHEHLSAIAIRMYEGIKQNLPFIKTEISNYHIDCLGKEQLIELNQFTLKDCQQTIANEYGFPTWEILHRQTDIEYNYSFETAINLMLAGDFAELKNLITSEPILLTQRSNYGHKATLLNYAGSNGVEMWRQQVPLNLAQIVKYLLASGADISATMNVYGGEFDTYAMVSTSIHPVKAGIIEEMKVVLDPS